MSMALVFCISMAALLGVADEESTLTLNDLTLKAAGIQKQVVPGARRLELVANRPEHVTKPPQGTVTGWAVLELCREDARLRVAVALDESNPAVPAVRADLNGDGEFGNDGAIETVVSLDDAGALKRYRFTLQVPVYFSEEPLNVVVHRYGAGESKRRRLDVDAIYCSADYGLVGQVMIDDQSYAAILADGQVRGDFTFPREDKSDSGLQLFIDANRDERFDPRVERFSIGDSIGVGKKAFVFERVSAEGDEVAVARTSRYDPRIRHISSASLGEGGTALSFTATLSNGKTVNFPDDYKGRIVLLDFWATWCGPCVREIPGVVQAYETHHEAGFEILGVSLDKPGDGAKLAKFTADRKMSWAQVFPGKAVAEQWGVSGIPHMVLVDGDTGTILASGTALRGGKLEGIVGDALKAKSAGAAVRP